MIRTERAHQRVEVNLAVEFTLEGRLITAKTRDISEGGCCIETSYALSESVKLALSLYLVVDGIEEPDFPPLQTHATVQWTAAGEETEMDAMHISGLKFVGLTEAQLVWLRARIGANA